MGDASYIEILDTAAGPRNRPVARISSLDLYIVIDSVVAIGAATLPRIERLATNLRTPPLATAATSPRQPSPTQDSSRASEALRDNYIHTSTADNLDAKGRSVSQRQPSTMDWHRREQRRRGAVGDDGHDKRPRRRRLPSASPQPAPH